MHGWELLAGRGRLAVAVTAGLCSTMGCARWWWAGSNGRRTGGRSSTCQHACHPPGGCPCVPPCVPGGATRRTAPRCRPQVVLRKLALALMPKLDDELRHSTAEDAAFYEHRLQVRAGLPLMGGWPVPQACGPWAAEAPPSTEAQQAAAAIQ